MTPLNTIVCTVLRVLHIDQSVIYGYIQQQVERKGRRVWRGEARMGFSQAVLKEVAAEAGVARLDAEYWHLVDRPGAGSVSALYAPGGRMVFGDFRLEGREAIEAFFHARNDSRPVRTTRHVSSNLRFEHLGRDTVRVHSIVTVYSGLGPPPLEIGLPSSVVEFTDVCRWQHDRWAYEERSGTAVFLGAGAAPFLLAQLPDGHPFRRAGADPSPVTSSAKHKETP